VTTCRTCVVVARRDAGQAPPWDVILRTPGWDLVHALGTAVEGWVVLVVRRHITAVADLTDEEDSSSGRWSRPSHALHDTVTCAKTYVAQFAEHPDHPHVHVHIVPRAADLPDDQRGPGIFSQLGVEDHRAVSEARMTEIAGRLRSRLDRHT
jgi:diadenosine tetraphosphate (Ap4A) HIT family hydrolase